MTITFDPEKRRAILDERGLDFAEAEALFLGPTVTVEDKRPASGEPRFQTLGLLTGRRIMVVWTPRPQTGQADARHIVSMRKCNEREEAAFGKRLA